MKVGNNMTVKEKMSARAALVESALEQLIPLPEDYNRPVYEAMRYSCLGGGKRLRGVLTLTTAKMGGLDMKQAEPFAAAVEMIHAYSLIHDDLPAMDNDDLRRGKPTCHLAFDEATAILAGDGLLNLAFETILEHSTLPAEVTLAAMRLLAKCSGCRGMIGGQTADMQAEKVQADAALLDYIHTHKTGDMIEAAAGMGVLISGKTEYMEPVATYARCVGLAFQIVDDILDVVGDSSKLGKPAGSDAKNHKSTYVSLYGIGQAKERVRQLTEAAQQAVGTFGEEGSFLAELADGLSLRSK